MQTAFLNLWKSGKHNYNTGYVINSVKNACLTKVSYNHRQSEDKRLTHSLDTIMPGLESGVVEANIAKAEDFIDPTANVEQKVLDREKLQELLFGSGLTASEFKGVLKRLGGGRRGVVLSEGSGGAAARAIVKYRRLHESRT